MKIHTRLILTCLAITGLTACATEESGVYRGGVRVQPRALDIQDHYSFRFVDKWRINHAWLSGPIELRGCQGYPSNSFRRLGGYGELGYEQNSPFVERKNVLHLVSEHNGSWRLSNRSEKIYGTNPEGKFEGFSPFCGHSFIKDSLDFLVLLIIKPDPAKGTDEWIQGAKPVTINGLHWLHKTIPIEDWSENRERLAAPIEYWVLKIPDTPYWMVLRFSASSGSKFGLGAGAHPEKHQLLLNLFHKIVESVKLEPITPINVDSLLEEGMLRAQKQQQQYEERSKDPKRMECASKGSLWRALDPQCPK